MEISTRNRGQDHFIHVEFFKGMLYLPVNWWKFQKFPRWTERRRGITVRISHIIFQKFDEFIVCDDPRLLAPSHQHSMGPLLDNFNDHKNHNPPMTIELVEFRGRRVDIPSQASSNVDVSQKWRSGPIADTRWSLLRNPSVRNIRHSHNRSSSRLN